MVRDSRKTLSDASTWGWNSAECWGRPTEVRQKTSARSGAARVQTRQLVPQRQTNDDALVEKNRVEAALSGKKHKQAASRQASVAVAPDVSASMNRPVRKTGNHYRSLSAFFKSKKSKPCTQMHANALFDVLSTDEALAEVASALRSNRRVYGPVVLLSRSQILRGL